MHEATCRDGQCISRSSICNGIRDCNDNSDEYNCGLWNPFWILKVIILINNYILKEQIYQAVRLFIYF